MTPQTEALKADFDAATAFVKLIGSFPVDGPGTYQPSAYAIQFSLVSKLDDGTLVAQVDPKKSTAFNAGMEDVIMEQFSTLAAQAVALLQKKYEDSLLAEEADLESQLAEISDIKNSRGIVPGGGDSQVKP